MLIVLGTVEADTTLRVVLLDVGVLGTADPTPVVSERVRCMEKEEPAPDVGSDENGFVL